MDHLDHDALEFLCEELHVEHVVGGRINLLVGVRPSATLAHVLQDPEAFARLAVALLTHFALKRGANLQHVRTPLALDGHVVSACKERGCGELMPLRIDDST